VPLTSLLSPLADNVTAAVAGLLFLDPTAELTPLGHLPRSLYGTRVLPMRETDSVLIDLPRSSPTHARRSYRVVANLQSDYTVTADVTRTDFGLQAHATRLEIAAASADEYIKRLRDSFAEYCSDVRVTDFNQGAEADSVWIRFTLIGHGLVSQSGDLRLLKGDLLHADAKDLLKRGDRVLPVYLGRPATYTTDIQWRLADGMRFEPCRDSTTVQCGIATISSCAVTDGDEARLQSTITIIGGCLPPASYESARTWERACHATQRVRLVIQ
jgi:hypothetical protein